MTRPHPPHRHLPAPAAASAMRRSSASPMRAGRSSPAREDIPDHCRGSELDHRPTDPETRQMSPFIEPQRDHRGCQVMAGQQRRRLAEGPLQNDWAV